MALRGHLDRLSRRQMIGWAQDTAPPDTPASVFVSVDGRVVGRCLADRPREDLVRAGIGHGRYGFDFAFADGALPALARCTIAVRREGDGAMLPGSPRSLDPIAAFDEDLQEGLACALAEPVDDIELDRRLAFLLDQAERLRRAPAQRRRSSALIEAVMPAVAALNTQISCWVATRPTAYGPWP